MNYRNNWNKKEGRKPRGASEAKELPFKTVLQSWFDSHEIGAEVDSQDVIEAWEALTGNLVKKLTKKILVDKKILYVYINSPALKNELMMIRTELCDKINEKLGYKRLYGITIK